MKNETMRSVSLSTERLLLIPFSISICENIMNNDFDFLARMDLRRGRSWPDHDVIESLPRILNNLQKVKFPSGFESYMVIKKSTSEVIGDISFKGFNAEDESVDIGYGIIQEDRRQGYAEEAAKELIRWAFASKSVRKITANCLHNNEGSRSLLKKLNFKETRKDNQMVFWLLSEENNGY